MFSIIRQSRVIVKHARNLKNLKNQAVDVAKGETIIALQVQCTLGNTYYAIQKKTKGLLVLPQSMFNNFNQFITEV